MDLHIPLARRSHGDGAGRRHQLAKAREKAEAARASLGEGKNPIEARDALNAVPTFGELADEVIATKAAGFRRERSAAIWRRALKVYAADLRPIRVDLVDTAAVLKALKPIWEAKNESANKARGCIEAVLDAARAKGLRVGENPARWRGSLDHLLPKRQKLTRGHHAAMPFANLPAFMARLQEREAMAALALQFAILTAARTGEVIGARWSEIDLASKVWTLPPGRMKAGREHRVPLGNRAVAILEKAQAGRVGAYVFPGPGKDRSLSTNALAALLKRLGIGVTTHGFRSSFRDWAGEASTFPRELAEAALAHTIGDATERAYRRGDALDKRRKLMDAWAAFLAHGGAGRLNVTPIRAVVA